MTIRTSLSLLAVTLITFSATAASSSGNIVSNGSFEDILDGGGSFPFWQTRGGLNAFINEGAKVAKGVNCVFIGGNPTGEMWQDLNTVIGQTYEFSFYERGDDPNQPERHSLLAVFWGQQEVGTFVRTNKPGWNYHVYSVTADSTTTRIDFFQNSSSIGEHGFPGVDGVSVVAVPEPSITCLVGSVILIFVGVTSARNRCIHKVTMKSESC